MAIELRTNKASALTYNEMDRNFSSFFYSASVDTTTNRLYLWYTGSANLNTSPNDNYGPARSVEVELQPTTGNNPTLVVAGNPRNIQFRHAIDPRLDADTGFIYNTSQQLGIGAAIPAINTKIHAVGSTVIPATLRLESTTSGNSQAKKATIDFYQGSTFMGTIGKDNNSNNALYIKTYPGRPNDDGFTKPIAPGNLIINIGNVTTSGAWTPVGLGIGTLVPTRALHVEGRGYFRDEVSIGTSTTQEKLLVNGNISTEIVTGKIGFRVWDNYATGSSGDTYAHYGLSKINGINPVNLSGYFGLTFATVGTENMRITQAGDVGINTPTPNAKLDVNGDTIVTGSFTTTGHAIVGLSATIGTSLTTVTSAAVGTNLTVGGTATIGNIPAGTAGAGTKILTANNAGQIQYITGTFPLGGIVMWAGSPTAPPTGWTLCDGRAPVGGVTIPDLRERFIVGAGGKNNEVVTYDFTTFTINSSLPFVVNAQGTVQSAFVQGTFTKVDDDSMVMNPTPSTAVFYNSAGQSTPGTPNVGRQYALYSLVGNSQATSYFLVYHQGLDNYVLYRGYVPQNGTSITTGYPYSLFPPGSIAVLSQTGNTVTHRPNISTIEWVPDINGYTVGEKGGFNNVKLHTSELSSHTHLMTQGNIGGNQGGTPYIYTSGDDATQAVDPRTAQAPPTNPTGGNFPHENRPPYYALAFIIYTGV